MRLRFVFCLAALAIAWPQVSNAQIQPVELKPTSDWAFEARGDACRISRSFGEGAKQTILAIDQSGSEGRYNVSVTGDHVSGPFGPLLKIAFGNQSPNTNSHHKTTTKNGRVQLKVYGIAIAPTRDSYDSDAKPAVLTSSELAEITKLHIYRVRPRPLSLAIGPIDEQLAALQLCANDLAVRLEAASRDSSHGGHPPIPITPEEWLWARDYPQDLFFKQMPGSLSFRLTVNADGQPSACAILQANSASLINGRLCNKLLRNAKFEPAHDRTSAPVASYYYSQITFKIKK